MQFVDGQTITELLLLTSCEFVDEQIVDGQTGLTLLLFDSEFVDLSTDRQ